MKFWIACVVLAFAAQAYAEEDFFEHELYEDSARTLNLNMSSTASAITLLGALILLGVIGYLIYAGGLLGNNNSYGYNRNDFYDQNGQYYDPNAYAQQYRSNDNGFDMGSSLNIIQWISMLQDLYEKFDYNDLECQKRLICEVMREPDFYGAAAQKFKTGFQYAKYLEVLSLPDDMRELLDEYLDANSRSEQNKECNEYFQCPYSIKDSFKKNLSGNSIF